MDKAQKLAELAHDVTGLLLPDVIENPDGSYTVPISHPLEDADDPKSGGSTVFTFSDIEYLRRSELNAFVEVVVHHGGELHKFSGRLNLASLSGREGFVRSLGRIAKSKKEFDSHLSVAIEAVQKAIQKRPRMIRITDAPPKQDKQWLLEPFVLDKAPNILFGEGGGGKTFVALRMMLSIATGVPFLGVAPARKCPVMFLDYEDDAAEGLDRIMKLCSSEAAKTEGSVPTLEDVQNNIFYFPAGGIPIHDLVPQLQEKIKEHKIEFLLIDSAVLACGGEPEKAENASRYFNSLAKLGITSLTIAHETKSENHEHVFGSIFWKNCTRNMWNAQSERNPVDSREISFGLFHRKCNHASLRPMVPLRIFHGEGFVDIVRGAAEEWDGKALSIGDRIVKFLRTGPKQFGQIVMELADVKKDVITMTLTRMHKRSILKQTGKDNMYWEIA